MRPGSPSSLTADENIEAENNLILDNRRITFREVADDIVAIFTGVLGMKRCDSKDCAKICKFVNFEMSNGIVQKSQDRKKHINFSQM